MKYDRFLLRSQEEHDAAGHVFNRMPVLPSLYCAHYPSSDDVPLSWSIPEVSLLSYLHELALCRRRVVRLLGANVILTNMCEGQDYRRIRQEMCLLREKLQSWSDMTRYLYQEDDRGGGDDGSVDPSSSHSDAWSALSTNDTVLAQ